MFAEANTSGLTPCSICAASISDPANEYRTLACGNCCAYVVKAAFREAAAETVRFGLPLDEAPDPDELQVEYPAYLNGIGEAVGELRRHTLDTMRNGELKRAEAELKRAGR